MRILCFGDSNTYGYDPRSVFGGRYPAEERWVDLLAAKTGWEVLNAGENGREILRRTWEYQQLDRLLTQYQPVDQLIVMLGSNDLLQGAEVPEAAARMEAFLTRLPLDREKLLLLAPPPMKLGAWVPEGRLVTACAQLAEEYKTLARKLGIRFADAGEWSIDLAFDGVHFTGECHRTFAQRLSEVCQSPGGMV